MRAREHLARVADKLRPVVARFFRERGKGGRYHLTDLETFAGALSNGVPGSVARVMRDMNASGELGYRLVSRSRSEYEVTKVPGAEEAPPAQRSLLP